jgi:GrpB-like predicted nucleotidyltransferase (UPF0157 family)
MDEIKIVEYDPRWPGQFDQEAERLRASLPEGALTRVEHFGSTAVPGLAAKPVIDILVGVRSLAEARNTVVPALEPLGYAFWYDNPRMDRLFFVRGLPPNGPRTHHVHVIEDGSPDWERLLFRDYLRAYPDERDRYARLKRDLAERHRDDREAYTEAKGAYVREVTERARREAAE